MLLHRLRAQVVEGPDAGSAVDLRVSALLIGSDPTCDLVLADPTVSRRHCTIESREQRYVLRDLESTNGTFLGDAQVTEVYLDPGARVRLGDTVLVFHPRQKWQRAPQSAGGRLGEMYGDSPAMRELFGLIAVVAKSALTSLIVGETGTGKELVARALHAESPRAQGAFVVVDCGAISASLIEAELFGHEKGAFTGADRARVGAFEAANGGTLMLDEIGELPPELQPKLLRVLERREIRKVGATAHVPIDVRIVAATHRDLPAMISEGRFRSDLYYRLGEVVLALPPLRERPDDIAGLATAFAEQESRRNGRSKTLSTAVIEHLSKLPWPGNVRELRNLVRRLVVLSPGERVELDDVRRALGGASPAPAPSAVHGTTSPSTEAWAPSLDGPLKDVRNAFNRAFERAYVERLLERASGDLDRAAELGDVHRKTLERLVREHKLR